MSLLDHHGKKLAGKHPRFIVVGDPDHEFSTYEILDWRYDHALFETPHGTYPMPVQNRAFMLKLCAWMNSLPSNEIASLNETGSTPPYPRDYYLRPGTEFYGPVDELYSTPPKYP